MLKKNERMRRRKVLWVKKKSSNFGKAAFPVRSSATAVRTTSHQSARTGREKSHATRR